MEIQITALHVDTEKGRTIAATKYASSKTNNEVIIISSATGVLQKYYARFATFFAKKGFTVYTFDYSGIGKSSVSLTALKQNKTTLKDWGQNDQAAIVAFAKKQYAEAKITLITHSVGGQFIGFNPNYKMIDKIVMVASQTGYWGDFRGIHSIKMFLFWYVLIPIFTPLFGYFPAKKLGLFENLPKQMVYEWATWGKQKSYMMHFKNSKEYLFDLIHTPMLALSFSKDSFAPKNAVDTMVQHYKNVDLTRIHHHSEKGQKHLKHFGFFKTSFKAPFWEQTLNWILTNSYT